MNPSALFYSFQAIIPFSLLIIIILINRCTPVQERQKRSSAIFLLNLSWKRTYSNFHLNLEFKYGSWWWWKRNKIQIYFLKVKQLILLNYSQFMYLWSSQKFIHKQCPRTRGIKWRKEPRRKAEGAFKAPVVVHK